MKTQTRGIGEKTQAKETRTIQLPLINLTSQTEATPENIRLSNGFVSQLKINTPAKFMVGANNRIKGVRSRGQGMEAIYPGLFGQTVFDQNNIASNLGFKHSYTQHTTCLVYQRPFSGGTGYISYMYLAVTNTASLNLGNISTPQKIDSLTKNIQIGESQLRSNGVVYNLPEAMGTQISFYANSLPGNDKLSIQSNINYPLATNSENSNFIAGYTYSINNTNRNYNLKKYINAKLLNFSPYNQ